MHDNYGFAHRLPPNTKHKNDMLRWAVKLCDMPYPYIMLSSLPPGLRVKHGNRSHSGFYTCVNISQSEYFSANQIHQQFGSCYIDSGNPDSSHIRIRQPYLHSPADISAQRALVSPSTCSVVATRLHCSGRRTVRRVTKPPAPELEASEDHIRNCVSSCFVTE